MRWRMPGQATSALGGRDLDVDNHSWWDVCVPRISTRAVTQKTAEDYLAGANAQRYHH